MKKILSIAFASLMLFSVIFFVASCKGNGETVTFTFEVEHLDGTKKSFEVTTDEANIGQALVDKGYISGENSTYGLYVKTVDGETLDFTNYYWALYVNGETAQTGVSFITPENGAVYAFKAEKISW